MDAQTAMESFRSWNHQEASLWREFGQPFYLDMMRMNAIGHYFDDLDEDFKRFRPFEACGARIDLSTVQWMLRDGGWRPLVMGAWYSLTQSREAIAEDLLYGMEACRGSLSAPPVAAAIAVVIGPEGIDALNAYVGRRPDISIETVAAIIGRLGGTAVTGHGEGGWIDAFQICDFAARRRLAFGQPVSDPRVGPHDA